MGLEGFFYKELDAKPKEGQKKKQRGSLGRKRSNTSKKGFDCMVCGLYEKGFLKHPKMEPYGKFKKKLLIMGEAPGETEDIKGEPFKGPVGQMFRPKFRKHKIDFERDCVVINAIDCRPTKKGKDGLVNREPTNLEIKCCHPRKLEVFKKYDPRVILLLGNSAIESFYGNNPYRRAGIASTKGGMLGVSALRGRVIPDKELNAWVCHSYHPSYIVRGNEDQEHIFDLDFDVFASMVGKPRPNFTDIDDVVVLTKFEYVMDLLDDIWTEDDLFAFDYETSSFRYHEGIHQCYMISLSRTNGKAFVFPYEMNKPDGTPWWNPYQLKRIAGRWRRLLKCAVPKVAYNIKHEEKASKALFGASVNNWVFDPMLSAHVLNSSMGTKGLKVQTYFKWGFHYGDDVNPYLKCAPHQKNRFEECDFDKASLYCGTDSSRTRKLYTLQNRIIKAENLTQAYQLLHDGTLAFARMEGEGIRIDVEKAERWKKEWEEELGNLKERIMNHRAVQKFAEIKGRLPNYKKKFSPKDLQVILFDVMKFAPLRETKTGYSVDESSLTEYARKSELVQWELRSRKLEKMRNTYLAQFLRFHVNGFIYPTFNLHIARSYRSSSNEPNFQNVPKRDERAAVLRSLIIPRDGNTILCGDYGSMEVRILACASNDRRLMEYIVGGGDMHGDWAGKLFLIKETDERFKRFRFLTKNGFIFPEFYGSYYVTIARQLNEHIPEEFHPTLTSKRREQRWESHLKKVEQAFWKEFHGVRKWQDKKIKVYKRTGYIQDDAWGFRRYGYLTRNKIYNFPIQGPAFHCLLWSIVQYYKQDVCKHISTKSRLCGQIHDEMFFDVHPEDKQEIKHRVTKIMSQDIREEQKWVTVPLEVEWSSGYNWQAKSSDNPDGMEEEKHRVINN